MILRSHKPNIFCANFQPRKAAAIPPRLLIVMLSIASIHSRSLSSSSVSYPKDEKVVNPPRIPTSIAMRYCSSIRMGAVLPVSAVARNPMMRQPRRLTARVPVGKSVELMVRFCVQPAMR